MTIKQTAGHDVLGEFAPEFAHLNDDILFGEVWNRNDKLSLKLRSVVTISALIGKGIVDSSLKYHLMSARKNGVTKSEMAEILTHIAFYAGWPNAWAAFRMAKEVYADKPAQALKPGDIVEIPANVKHWHGAKKNSWFSHLAFGFPGEDCSNEWLEPVTDEVYDAL